MNIFAAQIECLMNPNTWKRPATSREHVERLLQESNKYLTRQEISDATAINIHTLAAILGKIKPQMKNVKIGKKTFRAYKLPKPKA